MVIIMTILQTRTDMNAETYRQPIWHYYNAQDWLLQASPGVVLDFSQ